MVMTASILIYKSAPWDLATRYGTHSQQIADSSQHNIQTCPHGRLIDPPWPRTLASGSAASRFVEECIRPMLP